MSVTINTNYAAIVASNNLATSNKALQKSLNRLSSGTKIVNPSDDAGGLAVSMKLSAITKRQNAVNANIGNAVSFLQTQDGALKVSGKILDRMSELKTLNSDVTKSTSDKDNYNTEFIALQKQLTAITSEKFNDISLFGSSSLTVNTSEDASTSSQISIGGSSDLSSTSSGVGAVATTATSLGSVSLDSIKSAIQNVATMRASNGAEQSRLEFASELLTINQANLEAANSRIVDVDVAKESTELARLNVLTQAGTSMLSQANMSANMILKLLS